MQASSIVYAIFLAKKKLRYRQIRKWKLYNSFVHFTFTMHYTSSYISIIDFLFSYLNVLCMDVKSAKKTPKYLPTHTILKNVVNARKKRHILLCLYPRQLLLFHIRVWMRKRKTRKILKPLSSYLKFYRIFTLRATLKNPSKDSEGQKSSTNSLSLCKFRDLFFAAKKFQELKIYHFKKFSTE